MVNQILDSPGSSDLRMLVSSLLTQATRSDASQPLNTVSYLPSISDIMIATISPVMSD
jgi:hypothetical protein